jgi:hypothetical protein
MAQVKLLKLNSDGLPNEFDSANDDITLSSFTVNGGAVLSSTGLDMNNTDVSDVQDLGFTDPSTANIGLTAGNFVVDNLMFETKENVLTTAGAILFPVVADNADQVDAFRLPAISGAPSATPADGGDGYLVVNTSNGHPYVYVNGAWDDLATVDSANKVENEYTAGEDIDAAEVVYISAADTVSLADASADVSAKPIGIAGESILSAASGNIISDGVAGGFTGLTAGSRYYLDTTAGAVTASPPTGAGNNVVQIGFAKSATEMQLQMQYLGKKA